jgi:uncharacterized protein YxjI
LAIQLEHSQYTVRRKVLQLVGASFHVFDPRDQVVFYSQLKALKLKEDIRLYTGEDMQTELMTIGARQVMDISATYDVADSTTGEEVGALKREGLKSILMDEWTILDVDENEIGKVKESNRLTALLTRLLGGLIPQTYNITLGDTLVATMKQSANPFVMQVALDFGPDAQGLFDKRLGIAAAILMCAVEGRQS